VRHRYHRRAIGFYTRGKGRRRKVYPLTEASGGRFVSGGSISSIPASSLRNRNEWPDFTDEIWGWYWDDRISRWEPIYGKTTERREYDTGTGYSAPTIHPMKLEQRRRVEQKVDSGTILELYAGRGNLSKNVYAKRGRRLILVDTDKEALEQAHQKLRGSVRHETVDMDNVKWINEHMDPKDLSDLRLVDFDAFGCPADPATAFFEKYPVKHEVYVAFTDGSSLHNRYIQDEEGEKWLRSTYGVQRIPPSSRNGVVSTLDKFMELQGEKHGFKVQKVSVAHGDSNTVYVGYRIKPNGGAA